VSFYEPSVDGLIMWDAGEIRDERAEILRLAARKSLLEEPQASGNLLIVFLARHGFEGVVDLAHSVKDVGGLDQFQAYQLLYNQNRSSLLLRNFQNQVPEFTEYRIVTGHKFDDSRAQAQRDPAILEETRGQLLSVKCCFCGQVFVVGKDAVVVTDEDIDWRGSRQPDVIMPVVPSDKEAESAGGASVLLAVRKGEKRTWCCEKCHNQTPQSYSETLQ
jgi:hypothetical protein